jgi:magnesium transporter
MSDSKEVPQAPDGHASSGGAHRLGISSRKVGLAPGSVVYTGERHVEIPTVSAITYTVDEVRERESVPVAELRTPTGTGEGIHWVDVVGLHDTELIVAIGERYGLHPLLLEDVTAVRSRPTFVDYDDQAFVSLKMLSWSDDHRVRVEHVSLVLGEDYVISFQERPGDVFESVRNRIRAGKTRIRRRDAEYLWYALIDAVVDHYLVVIEKLAVRVDELEERVWEGDEETHVPADVQALRAEIVVVRRALWPLREEVERLAKAPPDWFSEEILPFMEDLRAHVLQISDSLETMREALASVMDAHLSLTATRTNDVMKVLTIMASIFIPLTFVAGIYGMNFEYMPELGKPWAYPVVWGVMLTLGLTMVAYFRRKGWL